MYVNANRILQSMAGASLAIALMAGAQTTTPAPAPAPAPAAAPTWSVGPMDLSGLIDGYYSYNANRPTQYSDWGQVNQLYNFNDQTDKFNLAEMRLTLNHNADPVGAHVDLFYGRANDLVNGENHDQADYVEQAYLSLAPPKAKGFDMDFGKFVTSAGAEVIESMNNWNYSRSILFAYAIPYYHFGLRTSMPVSKTETIGVQVVNGWNNVTSDNGGVTVGFTSAYVKPKYTWDLNVYTGPSNYNTQTGYKNLIDSTLLLTPNAKFNAYINYDYGQTRDASPSATPGGDGALNHWQGVAGAAHYQFSGTQALAGRYEYYSDPNGYTTGSNDGDGDLIGQDVQEFTATYEYKWAAGLLTRIEYRRDWSDIPFFDKGNSNKVDAQSTVTAAFVAFFGPHR